MSIKYIETYFPVSDIYSAATIINELSSKPGIRQIEKMSLDISFLSLIYQSFEGLINTIGEICYPGKWELNDKLTMKKGLIWYKFNANSEINRKMKCIHDFLKIDFIKHGKTIDNVKKLYKQRNSFIHVKMYKYEDNGLGSEGCNNSVGTHLDSKAIFNMIEDLLKWADGKNGVLNIVKNYARLLCSSYLKKNTHINLQLKANLEIVSETGELYSLTRFQTHDVI